MTKALDGEDFCSDDDCPTNLERQRAFNAAISIVFMIRWLLRIVGVAALISILYMFVRWTAH